MSKKLLIFILLIFHYFSYSQVIQLDLKVLLEGPFFTNLMIPALNIKGYLPLEQPYNNEPWKYPGNEQVSSIPDIKVVDWVLVDILQSNGDTSSITFNVIAQKAAFILIDGTVTDLDGLSNLSIPSDYSGAFYVQVHHRNHLPVTSAMSLVKNGDIYSYDFTSGPNQALGGPNSQKLLSYGVWSMFAADGNASNQIDNRDKNGVWFPQNGLSGYYDGDFNMDSDVNTNDITTRWALNAGLGRNRKLGILNVCNGNGRYFCDGDKAVYLTGTHTWDNMQDIGTIAFNYTDYLDWMEGFHHNFIRLWAFESPKGSDWALSTDHTFSPIPYKKVGTQYDITQLNQEYFTRLSQRIKEADQRGIYVGIMLFEGFSAEHTSIAWSNHPFKAGNNVNGMNADRFLVHTNTDLAVVEAQKLYVREVIDIVNYHNLENVLYEIGNEIPYTIESDQWQNDMIDFIHNYEFETYGVNRPVGKTFQNTGGNNEVLFNSPADWISPGLDGGFDCREGDAPIATGNKVIISDTDHYYYLWYSNLEYPVDMVWKSFTGGINVIHMDNWGGGSNIAGRLHGQPVAAIYDVIRYNMGWARDLADRMDLISTTPQPAISSTGYCLASETEYVVYLPQNVSSCTVDLSAVSGQLSVEWFDPLYGTFSYGSPVNGGGTQNFSSPYGDYSILYLKKLN
ncbi:MAG: hypothetical protein K9G76_02760 [Bacteroidales bacterium]|nr:hypothetical protein [Bacteroidales bacterium]MCF8405924.1 hypothetical protein [Bacteroidales bacterium]